MPRAKRKLQKQTVDTKYNYYAGCSIVSRHPIFSPLWHAASCWLEEKHPFPADSLAFATSDGNILCNPNALASPGEWARAIAHCLLHYSMNHFRNTEHPRLWNIACDCAVEKFLTDIKFGTPFSFGSLPAGIKASEENLYLHLVEAPDKAVSYGFGTAGRSASDMLIDYEVSGRGRRYGAYGNWSYLFAQGLAEAVRTAVRVASGDMENMSADPDGSKRSTAYRAKQWFISSYPLLGAVAAGFKLVEDPEVCRRMNVSVAAISPSLSEIYINPGHHLSDEEARFVLAHEFLHAALRHDIRQVWRDTFLWNVACDYVINQWLTEMRVGDRPNGVLFDEQFKGMNAEAVYDLIVRDMRTYRKLATLRGVGLGDILPGQFDPSSDPDDMDLDAFYRRAIAQGLEYHNEHERGYLPEGLIEEIRALSRPPIPWDVELARWFDDQFSPVEKIRSYARPSRRQSSTPDIPRPYWKISQASLDGRTFGVVLDTSGSMSRELLATALGTIASYSAARDVPATRVVFCDADAYDAGYMKPEDIAGTVKVKGRGGTILQPGIDLLDKAEDFPKEAPLLIITDGYCDKVVLCGRKHAFLIPQSATLPFVPKGKVFRMQ